MSSNIKWEISLGLCEISGHYDIKLSQSRETSKQNIPPPLQDRNLSISPAHPPSKQNSDKKRSQTSAFHHKEL